MSEIDCFYGVKNHYNKKACIVIIGNTEFVEFYENDIMISAWINQDKNKEWSATVAEKYCNGLLNVKPWEFKLNAT